MQSVSNIIPIAPILAVGIDVLVLAATVCALIAWGYMKGKHVLLALVFSLFPAALVTSFFPFYGFLVGVIPALTIGILKTSLFAILTIGIWVIVVRYMHISFVHAGFWRFIEVLSLSVTAVGLAIALLYTFTEFQTVYNFSSYIDRFCSTDFALFWWLLAPIATIPLFLRK